MRPGVEDVVFGFLRFRSGLAAHLHLSWLDPHKERRFTIVGSKRMATFDDMDPERKITVYDKGFDESAAPLRGLRRPLGRHLVARGSPAAEPLRLECEHFVACVREGRDADLRRAQRPRASSACSKALQTSLDESRREARRAQTVDDRRARGGHDLVGLIALQQRAHRDGQVGARDLVGRRQLDAGAVLAHRRLAVDRRRGSRPCARCRACARRGGERVGARRCARRRDATRARSPPTATGSATSSPRPASS